MADLEPAAYLAIVVALGATCQVVAWRLRLPSILLLLIIGFGLGQLVNPEDVLGRDVLFGGVTLAVGIILFEGSMSLRYKQFREVGRPIVRLCTATVMIAWALITLTLRLLDYSIEIALLIGAILVVTGPTVIGPILRMLRPTRRVSSLLRWEGIIVDPIGAVLALLVFQALTSIGSENAFSAVVQSLVMTIVVAFGVALALGFLLEVLTVNHVIPDFLQGITYLAGAIVAMVGADALQSESGLLAVTVLGIFLGNRSRLHLNHVAEFKEHLQVLFVGGLFIVLAGRVEPEQIAEVAPKAAIFVAVLVLLVRPISIQLGLLGTQVTREEKLLLSGMAPRGIVAAAVTSIFALEMQHAAEVAAELARTSTGNAADAYASHSQSLDRLAAEAANAVPLVFLLIVCSVAIYGLGVGRLAERLGLASQKPQGVLFVGARQWIVDAAKLLDAEGITTKVVAREGADVSRAKMAGVPVDRANILSDYAVKDMDLSGIGRLIAGTDSDDANSTAAREFAHVLGRANAFQVKRADDVADSSRDQRKRTAGHLTARAPFQPAMTYADLEAAVEAGMKVKKTRLTEEFTLEDFRNTHGPEAVLMFLLRGKQLEVVTPGSSIPDSDVTVIALVPGE